MLKGETPINLELIDKNNNKNYYLSTVRKLANEGNYFSLIKFIECSTPNVSKLYSYLFYFI